MNRHRYVLIHPPPPSLHYMRILWGGGWMNHSYPPLPTTNRYKNLGEWVNHPSVHAYTPPPQLLYKKSRRRENEKGSSRKKSPSHQVPDSEIRGGPLPPPRWFPYFLWAKTSEMYVDWGGVGLKVSLADAYALFQYSRMIVNSAWALSPLILVPLIDRATY